MGTEWPDSAGSPDPDPTAVECRLGTRCRHDRVQRREGRGSTTARLVLDQGRRPDLGSTRSGPEDEPATQGGAGDSATLSGVDNITVSQSGDIYVCEDGGDFDICLVTADFEVARFLTLDPVTHSGPVGIGNELTGVTFNPAGDRMYFGAQRSFEVAPAQGAGVVYEIRGPFRKAAPVRFPVTKAQAPKQIGIGKYLRAGLPVRLTLDELVGVNASSGPCAEHPAAGAAR